MTKLLINHGALLAAVAAAAVDHAHAAAAPARVTPPRPKIAPEVRAQLEARRDFLMQEMEKARAAKADRDFRYLNSAEIKRERKRARNRKTQGEM